MAHHTGSSLVFTDRRLSAVRAKHDSGTLYPHPRYLAASPWLPASCCCLVVPLLSNHGGMLSVAGPEGLMYTQPTSHCLAVCLLLKEQQGRLTSVKIESGLLPDFREAKLLMHWQSELREC